MDPDYKCSFCYPCDRHGGREGDGAGWGGGAVRVEVGIKAGRMEDLKVKGKVDQG